MTNDYDNVFSIDNARFSIVESFPANNAILPTEPLAKLQSLKTTHTHTAFEVFIIDDEPLVFVTNQGRKEYKNQILIVPPFLAHYTINSEKSYAFLFTVKQAEHTLFSFLTNLETTQESIAFPNSETVKILVKLLMETQTRLRESDPYKLPAIYTLLFLEIRDRLNNQSNPIHSLRFKQQCDYIETINDILLMRYMHKLTLSDIANELNLSLKQTARVINKGFNSTFSRLLLDRRLAISTIYLAQTKMKISEIIEATGFQTENYFFSQFKEKFGVTPLAYRARFQV